MQGKAVLAGFANRNSWTFRLRRRKSWRPRPELNRGTRICRPLRNHSATWPRASRYKGRASAARQHARCPNAARMLAVLRALPQKRALRAASQGQHDRLRRRAPHHGRRSGPHRRRDRSAHHRAHAGGAARAFVPAAAPLAYLDLDVPVSERGRPARAAQADGARQAAAGRRDRRRPTACSMSAAPPAIRPRVLAQLAGEVVALEEDAALARAAAEALAQSAGQSSRSWPAPLAAGWRGARALRRDRAARARREVVPDCAARTTQGSAAGWSASSAAGRWARRRSIAVATAIARPHSRCSTPRRRCCRASQSRRPSFSSRPVPSRYRMRGAQSRPRCGTERHCQLSIAR